MLLVDSNIWFAVNDRSAAAHAVCVEWVATNRADLAVTAPVAAETGWLLLDRFGPDKANTFLNLIATDRLAVIDTTSDDWERIVELCTTYATMELDVVDASIVAAAERLGHTEIATLNGRDFHVVRPRHCTGFVLLPEGITRPT